MGEAASGAFQGSFFARGNKTRVADVAPAQKRGSFHDVPPTTRTERFHPGLQPRNWPPLARRWRVTTVRHHGEVSPDVGGDLGEIQTLPAWIRQTSFTTRLVLKPRWELFFFRKVNLVCRDALLQRQQVLGREAATDGLLESTCTPTRTLLPRLCTSESRLNESPRRR